jgi:DNA-binding MarR family transcriptional regulator
MGGRCPCNHFRATLMGMASPNLSPPADELSPTELGAWRGLLRVHAAVCKALDAQLEREHGLPLSTYEVLIFLRDSPDRKMRMADLADRVLLSRSGMTRLVDRLEREGLLARQQCPADARGCNAVLTDAGERFIAAARPTHLAGIRELFLNRFSPEELEQLSEYWDRVVPGAAATKT